jgi:hypothetical protein
MRINKRLVKKIHRHYAMSKAEIIDAMIRDGFDFEKEDD